MAYNLKPEVGSRCQWWSGVSLEREKEQVSEEDISDWESEARLLPRKPYCGHETIEDGPQKWQVKTNREECCEINGLEWSTHLPPSNNLQKHLMHLEIYTTLPTIVSEAELCRALVYACQGFSSAYFTLVSGSTRWRATRVTLSSLSVESTASICGHILTTVAEPMTAVRAFSKIAGGGLREALLRVVSPFQKALGDYQDFSYALLSEDRGTQPTLLHLNLFLAPWMPTLRLLLLLPRLLPLGSECAERNARCLDGFYAAEREALVDVDGVLGTLFWGAFRSYLEELQEWLLKGFLPKDSIHIFLVFEGNQVVLRNLPSIPSFLRHLAHDFLWCGIHVRYLKHLLEGDFNSHGQCITTKTQCLLVSTNGQFQIHPTAFHENFSFLKFNNTSANNTLSLPFLLSNMEFHCRAVAVALTDKMNERGAAIHALVLQSIFFFQDQRIHSPLLRPLFDSLLQAAIHASTGFESNPVAMTKLLRNGIVHYFQANPLPEEMRQWLLTFSICLTSEHLETPFRSNLQNPLLPLQSIHLHLPPPPSAFASFHFPPPLLHAYRSTFSHLLQLKYALQLSHLSWIKSTHAQSTPRPWIVLLSTVRHIVSTLHDARMDTLAAHVPRQAHGLDALRRAREEEGGEILDECLLGDRHEVLREYRAQILGSAVSVLHVFLAPGGEGRDVGEFSGRMKTGTRFLLLLLEKRREEDESFFCDSNVSEADRILAGLRGLYSAA